MINRHPHIDTVQQVADAIWDGIVGPVAGLTKEGEEALGRRDVAARAGAHAIEELAVLCYSTAKSRFTSVLTDCPYFGQVQQAFQQRHRHLQ